MKLSIRILLAFSLVLVLSIIDTASNYLLSLKVEKNIRFLNKSQEVIRNSGSLHKSMIEMQSSFRGYLLTRDSAFLEGYRNGRKNIPSLFLGQEELVKDNDVQLSILDSIGILHKKWIEYSGKLIAARKNISGVSDSDIYDDLFQNRFKKGVGKRINDSITQKFLSFDRAEYRTREVHRKNLELSIQHTHTFSLTFFILTIIIGILSTWYLISLISKRIKTMVGFAENISRGKFDILEDNKRDELTSLSVSLNIMSKSLRSNIAELEARNTELDKFAHVVSHDLKAPIRGIHNVVTWIEEDHGKDIIPPVKNYLNIILQRTKRMEDLITGILDYARLRKVNHSEKTDVEQLVKDIVETIVPRTFSVKTEKLPVIFTDRLNLEQVFTNLVSNSVKYAGTVHGEIIISSVEYPEYFEFSVKDNGIGIEPEYHEKIFEIFQTLREKDEKESTGIGLAIIKKILDDRHETIRVNSNLGKGAEFLFTWAK